MRILTIFLLCTGTCLLAMCMNPSIGERSSLNNYAFESYELDRIYLKRELREISGITFARSGMLLAHNDERGVIYSLNPQNGNILASYSLGKEGKKQDFEDIAAVGDSVYLVTSSGVLFRIDELREGKNVKFKTFETGLQAKNDVEGLCYDPQSNALLLACKGNPGKNLKDFRAIYSWSLSRKKLDEKPRFLIRLDEIAPYSREGEFMPSGIEYCAETESYYIIAARGNTLVELSASGDILGQVLLPLSIHHQPEGIAFDKNQTLFIANEGGTANGYIVLYPRK
jgi:uncharacterized protein YjiK